jgi:hypothetical protein
VAKCVECGFLCARNLTTRELDEVEKSFRETGSPQPFIVTDGEGYEHSKSSYDAWLVCLLQKYDLISEIGSNGQQIAPPVLCNILQMERDCDGFTNWKQGFTPKEHLQIIDRKKALDWQTQRDIEDKKWREEQRTLDLTWREDQETKANARHRWDLIITGGCATIIIAGATILAAFIEKGK